MSYLGEREDFGRPVSPAAQYGRMMADRQPGGSSSISSQAKKDAFVQAQRQKFFDNRPDVSEDRIFRRTRQEGGIDQFKQALIDQGRVLKDSKGNVVLNTNTGEPVFLTGTGGILRDSKGNILRDTRGRSVSDVAQDLAFRFGPTPKEIAGDVTYTLGNLAEGLARVPGQVIDLYKELSPASKVLQGIESFFRAPSQVEPEQEQATGSIPTQKEIMGDELRNDMNLSSSEGASPDFLAAINNPMTMAREFNLERLLNQAQKVKDLGKVNVGGGTLGINNLIPFDPQINYNRQLGPGNLNLFFDPLKQSGGFNYSMTLANGGVASL